jgi:uncharacterized membrane protein
MALTGAFLGLVLGLLFHSSSLAVVFAIVGGIIGSNIASRQKPDRSGAAGPESSTQTARDLQLQVDILQSEMRTVMRRLAAVEAQLRGETAPLAGEAEAAEAPSPDVPTGTPAMAARAARGDERTKVPAPEPTPVTAPMAAPIATASPIEGPAPGPASAAAPTPAAPPAAPVPTRERPAQEATPAAQAPGRPPPAEPSWLVELVKRWIFGGNPLVKIGVLILFLGLGFLLRYVAEHTVVPIGLRYAGVAATGICLLLFGWRWRERKDNYGVILQGAGVGVMYLTTLAAMRLHPLIPPEFGFAILLAVAALSALLAILQDAIALAIAGTLFGFAAPVLASTGVPHHAVFFTYLTLLNLGIAAIAWRKAWRELNLIGFACTFFLAGSWGRKYWQPELLPTVEPFLLLFFVLYVLITFLFARRTLAQAPQEHGDDFERHVRDSVPHVSYVDGMLAFGVPFATFGLQYLVLRHIAYAPAFASLGFGLVYVALAALLFRKTGMRYALLNETMIALAVIFGSLAIPLGLEQKWTAAAWAVEAAGVYWVGIRQHRVHARMFAMLLLFGSALNFVATLRVAQGGAVLDGSLLGCAMLAIAIWWTWSLLRSAPEEQVHGFERALAPWLTAFGAFFTALLPFLLWPMQWAATALAILGAAGVSAAQRLKERALTLWSCLYQGVAGVLFMTTLRAASGGSVLGSGWSGLLATSLVGASMLVGAWAMSRREPAQADDRPAPSLDAVSSLGMLAGLVFINLAPLFVLPWRLAAMVWPLTGLATLWWAVRARHRAATVFALVLQAVAGAAHVGDRVFRFEHDGTLDVTAFWHSGFLGPVLIACAALVCARLLHRRDDPVERPLGWVALGWGGAWWAFGWTDELVRIMQPDDARAALAAVAMGTVLLWSEAARRLAWRQIGQATLAYVPVLTALAASDWIVPQASPHPLAGWGALAWPLALAVHFLLLRRQEAWVERRVGDLAHIGGAGLFVVLGAVELHWRFLQWTSADTAWPLLGWMIVPVLYLWMLTSMRMRLRTRWPVADHLDAYTIVSVVPMAIYLLAWVWVANVVSDGNAAPLPYLPIVNPLELAQAAVLVAFVGWWWSLRAHPALADRGALIAGAAGASAFAVVTGSVARACHHWGDVPWHIPALLDSSLFQTSLSIVWSVLGIGVMIAGNRLQRRRVWIAGAVLMAVVVAKLFLVELADRGSLTRIVSFIVVGLLLLLVGYFAPLPPRRDSISDSADTASAS